MKNKDTQLLEEAYGSVINRESGLRGIGQDIAKQINESINIRYDHPRWGKNTLMPFYDVYQGMSKRFTRGDHAQYMDPKFVVSLSDTSAEANELYKTKYGIDIKTIGQKALEVVKSLGQSVSLAGPHQSDRTEAVQYKGIYILLDSPLKFGLVTKNKLKGLMHRSQ
jgi:hypothetical protein